MGNVVVMAAIRLAAKEALKAAAKQALQAAPVLVAAVVSEGLAAGGAAAAAGGAAAAAGGAAAAAGGAAAAAGGAAAAAGGAAAAAGGAAAAAGGAAAAAGGAMAIVPVALSIGGMAVGSYAMYRAAQTAINLLGAVFSEPPPNPPQVPRLLGDMTQERLIQRARDTLGMDVVGQYNFGICGTAGAGMRKVTILRLCMNIYVFCYFLR